MTKNISKRDAVTLLEIAHKTLTGAVREDLIRVIEKLKNILPFSRVLGTQVSIKSLNPCLQIDTQWHLFTYGVEDEFIREYLQKEMIHRDPAVMAMALTRDFFAIQDLLKKNPALRRTDAYEFAERLKILHGFSCPVMEHNRRVMSTFSFTTQGEPLKIKPNVVAITKYVVPFLAELFKKTLKLPEKPDRVPLTPREREVLKWMKEGKGSWEISRILNISENTVNFHVANILRKFQAGKRVQAVALALGQGLIEL